MRRVLADIRERVNAGAAISDAFAEQGDLFPRLYWTSLKAGEKSGEIESVLRRYVKYQRTIMTLTRKVISTLVYPAILILLSIVLIAILMTVVIPKFQEFFGDFKAELPLLTVVVIRTATFLRSNILWLVGGLAVAAFFGSRWLKSPRGAEMGDAMVLRIPVLGGIFRRFAITQFTRSLATLLGGGTPLVPALENAAAAVGNRYVSRRVADVIPRVREGGELWRALEGTGIFTNLTIEMIKVGEASGALEEMLSSVSEFYDDLLRRAGDPGHHGRRDHDDPPLGVPADLPPHVADQRMKRKGMRYAVRGLRGESLPGPDRAPRTAHRTPARVLEDRSG